MTTQADGGVELRDLHTGEHMSIPDLPFRTTYLFSSDGSTFVVLAEREVSLWTRSMPTKPWHHLTSFTLDEEVGAGALSPSGEKLALSQGREFLVWDSLVKGMSQRTASHVFQLEKEIFSLAFSRDEHFVASSAGLIGTLDVWELGSNTLAMSFGSAGTTNQLHFTGDGRYIVSGHSNVLSLHAWQQVSLLEDACSRATYNFTQKEWEKFFRNEAYKEICPKLPRLTPSRSVE